MSQHDPQQPMTPPAPIPGQQPATGAPGHGVPAQTGAPVPFAAQSQFGTPGPFTTPGQFGTPGPSGASGQFAAPGVHAPVQGAVKRPSVLGPWGARIVLIVVAACALVSVIFILFGSGGDTISRVVTTDFALIAFALLVWLDTVIGSYRPEWFEFTSLAVDAYLLLLWILTVWTFDEGAVAGLALGIWGGLLCLLFVRAMLALTDLARYLYSVWESTVTRALAYVSGCSFGVLAIMVTIPTPTPFNDLWDLDYYGRIVAAVAVIGGVALVLVPLWGLLSNRAHGGPRRPVAYGSPAGTPSAYGAPAGYPVAAYPASGHPAGQPVPPAPSPVPGQPAPLSSQAGGSGVAGSPAGALAAHPPLAWPRLSNGAPVPAGSDGAPDFTAVPGAALAWPTFADGTPVPAAPDGSPLYR